MGLAKSWPAAHGPRRPSGPAARRPSGPRPTACGPWPGGAVAQSWFSTVFFCPAVNPRACTDLHRVWACKMDDGEFEFVYHFNHLNPCFCLLHAVQIRTFSFSVHSSLYRNRQRTFIIEIIFKPYTKHTLSHMQGKKGSKRIEMIIKMVNEFKLTVVHFARPNPMQICACAWIYRWTKRLWKISTGPPGRRASGPLDRRGPLGRRRPWAAGLLLAKPQVGCIWIVFFSTLLKIVKIFWKLKGTMLRNVNIMGKENIAF